MNKIVNQNGKVLTIFIVVFGFLLISLAVITAFFLNKEIEKRKSIEIQLVESLDSQQRLDDELKQVQKEKYILVEKNKELDKKINSLLDENELVKGLRDEIKNEVSSMKSQLEKEISEKEKLRRELANEMDLTEKKIVELQNKLKLEQELRKKVEKIKGDLEAENLKLTQDIKERSSEIDNLKERLIEPMAAVTSYESRSTENLMTNASRDDGVSISDFSAVAESTMAPPKSKKRFKKDPNQISSIELEPINVVGTMGDQPDMADEMKMVSANTGLPPNRSANLELEPVVIQPPEPTEAIADEALGYKLTALPDDLPEGRVLSVDRDTNFVIINLGDKDGVKPGAVLAVYRGEDYLGDIAVTRVQDEMAAADLIPPFSSQIVRNNDQVLAK